MVNKSPIIYATGYSDQQHNISCTYVWYHDLHLVAYITLLCDSIRLNDHQRQRFGEKGIPYKSLPAIKIGRMCVDDQFRGKGIGALMIRFAIQQAQFISEYSGCRFITVDAKHNAVGFYTKMKFVSSHQNHETVVRMYFDLNDGH